MDGLTAIGLLVFLILKVRSEIFWKKVEFEIFKLILVAVIIIGVIRWISGIATQSLLWIDKTISATQAWIIEIIHNYGLSMLIGGSVLLFGGIAIKYINTQSYDFSHIMRRRSVSNNSTVDPVSWVLILTTMGSIIAFIAEIVQLLF